jgi:hypothetical protein
MDSNSKPEDNTNENISKLTDESDENKTLSSKLPRKVEYCPCKILQYVILKSLVCTFPAEYCEYAGMYSKCKTWLKEKYPNLLKEESKVYLHSITPEEDSKIEEKPVEEAKQEKKDESSINLINSKMNSTCYRRR